MLSHLSPSGVQRLPGLKDKRLNLPPEDQVLLDKSRYLGHRYWSCKSRCSSSVVSMIPGRSQVTGSQSGSHVLSGKKKRKITAPFPTPKAAPDVHRVTALVSGSLFISDVPGYSVTSVRMDVLEGTQMMLSLLFQFLSPSPG